MRIYAPTPLCGKGDQEKSLTLDSACLTVKNLDTEATLELWAQSQECYKCLPWKYLTLAAKSSQDLAVNTTYPTLLYIQTINKTDVHKLTYHFGQYGKYSLGFSTKMMNEVYILSAANLEYLPIFLAVFYFTLLAIIWIIVRKISCGESQASQSVLPRTVYDSCYLPDALRPGGCMHSLEAFRGFVICMMMFVNSGGGKYHFFQHAPWNGLTFADLVFPCVDNTNLPTFRICGILQCKAVTFLIMSMMESTLMKLPDSQNREYVWYWPVEEVVRSWLQWLITLVLVAVHTAVTFGVKVPGCPRGYLGPGGMHEGGKHSNCTGGVAGYLDRVILGSQHLYTDTTSIPIYNNDITHDPEGMLSTLNALLLAQFGASAGRIMVNYPSHQSRLKRWLLWGAVSGFAGGCLCGWRQEGGLIPLNRNLWSLSLILVIASLAFFVHSFFYFIIHVLQLWNGKPLRYCGKSAIFMFCAHRICKSLFPFEWTPVGEYHAYYLIMNLWSLCLWMTIAYWLSKKKIVLDV